MKLTNGGCVIDVPENEAGIFLRGGFKRVDGKPSATKPTEPEAPIDEAPAEGEQPKSHGIFNRGGA